MKNSSSVFKDEIDEKIIKKDELAPILKKLCLEGTQFLDESAAIQVKNEALKNLKERLLHRAEIIQRRLEFEQNILEDAFQKLRKKGENISNFD